MSLSRLTNARIYTMDPSRALASSLTLENGRIRALDDDRARSLPHQKHTLDLQGRTILPGLTDAHLHLRKVALNLKQLDVETETRSACLQRVAARARELPAGEWILGHGWNQNRWQEGYGTPGDLDQAAPENPVYLTAKSLHASWANSLALEKAGITAETADPQGGRLSRDQRGTPTGFLFESAVQLLEQVLPDPDVEETARAIQQAQPQLWKAGLTGVHDFDRRTCFAALQLLDARQKLKLRVLKSIPLALLSEAIQLGLRTGFGGEMLWIGGIKAFADGALGPQTAALLDPYQGSETDRGLLLITEEDLTAQAIQAADSGLAMAVHAIGDRANRIVLNALEKVRRYEQKHGLPALPHRIEHVQLISPQDKGRLADLDITASMQPIHAVSDMKMADRFWGERVTLAYASRTQLDQGALVVFGSDAPVESFNPFLGIHAAVTRQCVDGSPGPQGWIPEERINVKEAFQGFTSAPAQAARREHFLGKLIPGFAADLIVLEQDPFTLPADELQYLKPVGTMIAGEWVYRSF